MASFPICTHGLYKSIMPAVKTWVVQPSVVENWLNNCMFPLCSGCNDAMKKVYVNTALVNHDQPRSSCGVSTVMVICGKCGTVLFVSVGAMYKAAHGIAERPELGDGETLTYILEYESMVENGRLESKSWYKLVDRKPMQEMLNIIE